jgi:hypothetical protein
VPFHAVSGLGARAAIRYLRFIEGFVRMRERLQARASFRA